MIIRYLIDDCSSRLVLALQSPQHGILPPRPQASVLTIPTVVSTPPETPLRLARKLAAEVVAIWETVSHWTWNQKRSTDHLRPLISFEPQLTPPLYLQLLPSLWPQLFGQLHAASDEDIR